MNNFVFHAPTKVIFGKDTQNSLGDELKAYGAGRVLLHYGSASAEKSGLLKKVRDILNVSKIDFTELGGVLPNPRLTLVEEGVEICKQENIDFILAVGGGSVIDSAKAIAMAAKSSFEPWEAFSNESGEKALPLGVILTIPAAGSEMSFNYVITDNRPDDPKDYIKRGFRNQALRPKFSILNPELMATLPQYQVGCGVTDILMHIMERYFSNTKDTEISDEMCEAVMRVVINNAKAAYDDPGNYTAMAEIVWAGSLAHNGLLGCGKEEDWATHQMEHEIGAIYDVAHGAGLAAVWPSWARYVIDENPMRFFRFATQVLGVKPNFDDIKVTGLAGISKMEQFYHSIGMPITLSELGVGIDQIDIMAKKCAWNGKRTVGGLKALNEEDIKKIYEMAK